MFLVSPILQIAKVDAAPLNYLDYQGRLSDQNGNLLTGNYYITFCIYTTSAPATACTPVASPAAGATSALHSAIWGETQYFSATNSPDNHVINGVFNAKLGSQVAFASNLFSANSDLWLGVSVYNGSSWDSQMTPLQEIVSTGYAINSGTVGGFTPSQTPGASNVPVLDGSGNLTLPSGGTLFVGGGSGLSITSSAITAPGALGVSSGGSAALTLTSKSGTLTLGTGTNTIANTDASTALTLNPTGNVQFFSSSNAITSAGNLTIAGVLTTNGVGTSTINDDLTEKNGNVTISPVTTPVSSASLSQTASGALAATTYYVVYTWVNADGETEISPESNLAVSVNNVLKVTVPSFPVTVTSANVYVSNTGGGGSTHETLQASISSSGGTWTEPNSGLVVGASEPTLNTAGGKLNVNNTETITVDQDFWNGLTLNNSNAAATVSPNIQLSVNGTSRYIRAEGSSNPIIKFLSTSGGVVDTFDNTGNIISSGADNIFSSAVTASANFGTVNIGAGGFAGGGGNNFAGSSSGTQLAINAASGYSGDLVDFQTAATTEFKIDASGNITVAGTIGSSGSLLHVSTDLQLDNRDLIIATQTAPNSAPTLNSSASTGGHLSNATYFVEYTWVGADGDTTPSPEASIALSGGTSTQKFNIVIASFPSGTTQANIYMSTSTGTETFQEVTSTTTTSFTITMTTNGALAPTVNESGGNLVARGQLTGAGSNSASTSLSNGSLAIATSATTLATLTLTVVQTSDVFAYLSGSVLSGDTTGIRFDLVLDPNGSNTDETARNGAWAEILSGQDNYSGIVGMHQLAAGTHQFRVTATSLNAGTETVNIGMYFSVSVI